MQTPTWKPDPDNPNRMSEEDRKRMGLALAEFGDLGGIVLNRRTGLLVCGHQRMQTLEGAKITAKDLAKPTTTGTVARGNVEHKGNRFTLRVVDWPQPKAHAAMLAANRFARLGKDDKDQLAAILQELTEADISTDLAGYVADAPQAPTEAAAADALAENIASTPEWQEKYDEAEKREEKLHAKLKSLSATQPDALKRGNAVIISATHSEALVIADESLADVLTELRRYAEAGEESPLARLLEGAHPL